MATLAPSTFLQCLRKSGLLREDQLAATIAEVGEEEPALSRHLVARELLTRFQARQLRTGAYKFHVDKYVVIDFVGRGANSVVLKARHTLLRNRIVALKTVDAENVRQREELARQFRHEVDVVARLDHPNIVRAYDVVTLRRQMYLVLEYVEGSDLAQLVKRFGVLPVPEAVDYTLQAARGLAYAHRQGVVHRDIKPANLLLARDGVVKLADLGLARLLWRSGTDGGPGACLGTPEFMAPEQAQDADRVDGRSDLYSLGGTLFHLLTGELPVKGGSYYHKLKQLLTVTPRPLAEVRPDVPRALAEVVDRLRSPDPANRPASAEEVIAALEPFAGNVLPSKDPRRWNGRRKADLLLNVLTAKMTAAEACARHGLTEEELAKWQHCFLEGAVQSLNGTAGPSAVASETLRELYAKIGAQAMEIELLKGRTS
jgi:serine/threonine protein kinase